MSAGKKITLKDVARRADVSIATASRILNKSSGVHPKLRQAVNEAVEELGYYQNSIARSLKTNATFTIGFVTADISNPYFIVVAKAVEDIVRDKHYNLFMCSTENDADREAEYIRLLMGRNIDALVLNGTGYNQELVAQISRRIPVILVHRRYHSSDFRGDLVDSDNEHGTYQLAKHLISFGHHRIFVIKGSAHTSTNAERFKGFYAAMQELAGIEVKANYPFQYSGDFSMQSGVKAIDFMCKLPVMPTAVLTLNNSMALGALEGLKMKNLRIPEDVSIATYNEIDFRELMSVRLTVFRVNPRELGLQVGSALLDRLQDPDIPNRDLIVNGYMLPGNSISIPRGDFPEERRDCIAGMRP